MKKSELIECVKHYQELKEAPVWEEIHKRKDELTDKFIKKYGLDKWQDAFITAVDDWKEIHGKIRSDNKGATFANAKIEVCNLYIYENDYTKDRLSTILTNKIIDFVKADDYIISRRKLVNDIDDEYRKLFDNIEPMKSAKKIYDFLIGLGFTDEDISPFISDEHALVLQSVNMNLIK